MFDRIPTCPGRTKITREDGSVEYVTIERADKPKQDGTPLNKGSLLTDVACDLLSISRKSTPNDAFVALSIGPGKYGFKITVKTPGGNPMSGITISGITAPNGTPAVTDANGTVLGVAPNASPTITIPSPYLDILEKSVTLNATGTITVYEFTMSRIPHSEFDFDFSRYFDLSKDVAFTDWCVVGGGGGGGAATGTYEPTSKDRLTPVASGGGGGYVRNIFNVSGGGHYNVSVGAGGIAYSANIGVASRFYKYGTNGGASSVMRHGGTFISAGGGEGGRAAPESIEVIGGAGGSGGGSGGFFNTNRVDHVGGSDGSNGGGWIVGQGGASGQGTTTRKFGEASGTLFSSGGCGTTMDIPIQSNTGGGYSSSKGVPYGDGGTNVQGGDGKTRGSGGGGAMAYIYSGFDDVMVNLKAGDGADGYVSLRIRWY